MRVVTLVGGTGFVGRYTAQAFVAAGWRVRVASRTPEAILELGDREGEDALVKVEPMAADIRTGEGLDAAVAGADAVVNLVGILAPGGGQTFDGVQAKGSRRVAEAAKGAGVPRFIQVSAIGADADSPARYAQTKAAGEAAVLESYPGAAILRPSIVFGPEDQFFNRFAGMAQISPMIPVVGAETKFQPIYVRDVAKAVVAAAEGDAAGVLELGGPKTYSFAELMTLM
ncbi:MAG: SDR family NAD(P)-dependent oxidoreductase, partial [Pseudomonadota bacterium]